MKGPLSLGDFWMQAMNQVITANRLHDGAVVFFAAERSWVERLDRAALYETKETAAAALDIAKRDEARNLVLDIYAIDVSASSGAIVPQKLREAIRARGPTVHPKYAKPGSAPAVAEEDDHVSV